MSALAEKWLKSCCTMKEIRLQAEKHPQLKTELESSLKPTIEILDDLFKQLTLKDKSFQSFTPSVSDLLKAGNLLKKLNPELSIKGPWSTTHVTKTFPEILTAIKCHLVKQRYYYNGVFKCIPGSENHCGICREPVSSKEFLIELRTKLLLPDPEPDPKRTGKFLSYTDCKFNGQNTSEKHLPSLNDRRKASHAGLNSQTARGFVICVSCEKPRVYYSAKKLLKDDKKFLQIAFDSIDFTCGSALISQSHPNAGVAGLYNKILTNTSLTCWNHVEYAYYSKSGKSFPIVCCWCGGSVTSDDLKAREEKLKEITTCLPLCSKPACVQKGWQTRGKKRVLVVNQNSKRAKKAKIASQKKRKAKDSGTGDRKRKKK